MIPLTSPCPPPIRERGLIGLSSEAVNRIRTARGVTAIRVDVALVLRPKADGDLGRWMQWLLTAHARRYHRHHGTSGHIWRGRFKAFPIQDDDHLVAVLRYVERNPVRAELVARAEDWAWSSVPGWRQKDPLLYRGKPPVRGPHWLRTVNAPLSAGDLQRLRLSVSRGRPFGDESWTRKTVKRLGLESCLRPPGRPRKTEA